MVARTEIEASGDSVRPLRETSRVKGQEGQQAAVKVLDRELMITRVFLSKVSYVHRVALSTTRTALTP
jgi:hypothetical protein